MYFICFLRFYMLFYYLFIFSFLFFSCLSFLLSLSIGLRHNLFVPTACFTYDIFFCMFFSLTRILCLFAYILSVLCQLFMFYCIFCILFSISAKLFSFLVWYLHNISFSLLHNCCCRYCLFGSALQNDFIF